jgi:hypothetical protein
MMELTRRRPCSIARGNRTRRGSDSCDTSHRGGASPFLPRFPLFLLSLPFPAPRNHAAIALLDPNPSPLTIGNRSRPRPVGSASPISIRTIGFLLRGRLVRAPYWKAGAEMAMPGSPARPGFSALRGARWRADLGVLPDSAAISIDELRRAAADSRRRYRLGAFHFLLRSTTEKLLPFSEMISYWANVFWT